MARLDRAIHIQAGVHVASTLARMDACQTPDPCRCPLCGGPNACAMTLPEAERPAGPCWCVGVTFTQELLARVPPQMQRKACICQNCAKAAQTSAPAAA